MAQNTGVPEDLEAKLWEAADKLRGHLDAAEYKSVVLGLIFLKYISDAFQDVYEALQSQEYADPEDPDEYLAERVFFVPPDARWDEEIKPNAKKSDIGTIIDNAMLAIEDKNSSLKGVLPTDYGREDLDKRRLGELVDLISTIALGTEGARSQDILGRVYEYFLGQFASAEGKKGGEFYTPKSIVRLLVAMLEPYKGRVYDPCCGSGGMFVQSEQFIEEHGGNLGDISVFGQESNPTTWRLCKMNLAIRGIDANLGDQAADTFHNNLHRDLRADYVMATPPFNMEWSKDLLAEDHRWQYGLPPKNNANFAWLQHMIYHLAPNGRAGVVLANGSMSSQTGGEGDVREALIKADLIECMVALPSQLFHNTGIPACLWFLNKKKARHRKGQVLFVDARRMGHLVDRTLRDFEDEDIELITQLFYAWQENGDYEDVPGFCKSADLQELEGHGFVLTPGRYVGAPDIEEDTEDFEVKMDRLTSSLGDQFRESARLQHEITSRLADIGYQVNE